jgi:hypothetical protein
MVYYPGAALNLEKYYTDTNWTTGLLNLQAFIVGASRTRDDGALVYCKHFKKNVFRLLSYI